MRKLLVLDLSTVSTGWATFNMDTKGLLEYGVIHPIHEKGHSRLKYPAATIKKSISVTDQVIALIDRERPEHIVIEEVNRGISRIGQKSLDMLHGILLLSLMTTALDLINLVEYIDSNGKTGWRTHLGLKLSDVDKLHNKEVKKWNRGKKNRPKKVVINWKHLASRYVKQAYGLILDVDELESNGDIVDAICIGTAVLQKKG